MKFSNLFLLLSIYFFFSCERENKNNSEEHSVEESSKELSMRLNADKYGMSQYVVALLKKGPNRGQDSAEASKLQTAHMANIGRMAESGDLVLAGPFMGNGEYQGIYIFNVKTVEEAQKLTETDPAVKAGRLTMELIPWYGSSALKEVNAIHAKIAVENP